MATESVRITIPEGLAFGDLRLSRDPASGDVAFDWEPIRRICEASGLPPDWFESRPEDALCALLVAWYQQAKAAGEALDPVQEQILAEIEAEDRFGIAGVQSGSGRLQ